MLLNVARLYLLFHTVFLTLVSLVVFWCAVSMFPFSHSFIIIFAPPVPLLQVPFPCALLICGPVNQLNAIDFLIGYYYFLLYYLVIMDIIMSMLCRMQSPGFVWGPPGHLSSLGRVVIAFIERRRRLCLMILFTICF
jgi:hypothetical protein